MNMVDGVMTLSAAQALFYNQTALILSGLPNTTQYITYPPQPKAGSVTMVSISLDSVWLPVTYGESLTRRAIKRDIYAQDCLHE